MRLVLLLSKLLLLKLLPPRRRRVRGRKVRRRRVRGRKVRVCKAANLRRQDGRWHCRNRRDYACCLQLLALPRQRGLVCSHEPRCFKDQFIGRCHVVKLARFGVLCSRPLVAEVEHLGNGAVQVQKLVCRRQVPPAVHKPVPSVGHAQQDVEHGVECVFWHNPASVALMMLLEENQDSRVQRVVPGRIEFVLVVLGKSAAANCKLGGRLSWSPLAVDCFLRLQLHSHHDARTLVPFRIRRPRLPHARWKRKWLVRRSRRASRRVRQPHSRLL